MEEQKCCVSGKEATICREWIINFAYPRQNMNRTYSSYSLKHLAENWYGEYVSNESFIEAARELGFKCDPVKGTPNYYFNMGFVKGALDGRRS